MKNGVNFFMYGHLIMAISGQIENGYKLGVYTKIMLYV